VNVGGWIEFDSGAVEMRVGVSWISQELAEQNLAAGYLSFDSALEAAKESWENALSKITVTSDSEEDLQKFYTG
jgi:putative alpha-1,2-mannosidase